MARSTPIGTKHGGVYVQGIEHLRKRLEAVASISESYANEWAVRAADNMRAKVPVRTGRLRDSIVPHDGGEVWAPFWAIFIDKGTKAHTITPKSEAKRGRSAPRTSFASGPRGGSLQRGSPSLVFKGRNGTVFTKRVNHPGTRKRPFIRTAARMAWNDELPSAAIIEAWNSAKIRKGIYVIGARKAAAARRARR